MDFTEPAGETARMLGRERLESWPSLRFLCSASLRAAVEGGGVDGSMGAGAGVGVGGPLMRLWSLRFVE